MLSFQTFQDVHPSLSWLQVRLEVFKIGWLQVSPVASKLAHLGNMAPSWTKLAWSCAQLAPVGNLVPRLPQDLLLRALGVKFYINLCCFGKLFGSRLCTPGASESWTLLNKSGLCPELWLFFRVWVMNPAKHNSSGSWTLPWIRVWYLNSAKNSGLGPELC